MTAASLHWAIVMLMDGWCPQPSALFVLILSLLVYTWASSLDLQWHSWFSVKILLKFMLSLRHDNAINTETYMPTVVWTPEAIWLCPLCFWFSSDDERKLSWALETTCVCVGKDCRQEWGHWTEPSPEPSLCRCALHHVYVVCPNFRMWKSCLRHIIKCPTLSWYM